MPRSPKLDPEKLWDKLRVFLRQGPKISRTLTEHLGISQPALSRLLKAHSDEIFVAGKTKNATYALKRAPADGAMEISVHAIDRQGKAAKQGTLIGVFPGYYWKTRQATESRFFPGLPYFLEDLRPSGFLGRLVPHQHPELKAPSDISKWSADETLRYLTIFGWDLIGNLILGEEAFSRYLQRLQSGTDAIPSEKRAQTYSEMADNIMKLGDPGSSAGGEQPKFLVTKHPHRQVIVKFSPRRESALAERRADLLWCELLAKQVLREQGVAASISEIIESGNRTFLETERFDRLNGIGRRGVISLLALDLEFVGLGAGWVPVSRALLKRKIISQEIFTRIEWLELFGDLIANSDKHLGNLSFFTENGKIQELTPAYDMLPMLYYARDELVHRDFDPPPPSPSTATLWRSALLAAIEFWRRVSHHDRISKSFRQIAADNHEKLLKLRPLVNALPVD